MRGEDAKAKNRRDVLSYLCLLFLRDGETVKNERSGKDEWRIHACRASSATFRKL